MSGKSTEELIHFMAEMMTDEATKNFEDPASPTTLTNQIKCRPSFKPR